MPTRGDRHPFAEMFAAALSTHVMRSAGHENDPPPLERLLPPGLTEPELSGLIGTLIAADHDLREDRTTAAIRHMELAETRIRLGMGRLPEPAQARQDAAIREIAAARQAAERRDSAAGCRALAEAVRSILAGFGQR